MNSITFPRCDTCGRAIINQKDDCPCYYHPNLHLFFHLNCLPRLYRINDAARLVYLWTDDLELEWSK